MPASTAGSGFSPIVDKMGFALDIKVQSSGLEISIDKEHVLVKDQDDLRDIRKEELDQMAYDQPIINFMDENDLRFTVAAP
jgi:hypothetical protein